MTFPQRRLQHAPGHGRIFGALEFQVVETPIRQTDDQVWTAHLHCGIFHGQHGMRLPTDEQL